MTVLISCVNNECLPILKENVPSLGVFVGIYLKIQNRCLGSSSTIDAFALQAKPTGKQRGYSVLPETPDHNRQRKEIPPSPKTNQQC